MSLPIRKVAVTPEMAEQFREYAWRNRTSMSSIVQEICKHLADDPRYFKQFVEQPTRGLTQVITLYVNDAEWSAAKESMYLARIPLSVGIRERISAALASA